MKHKKLALALLTAALTMPVATLADDAYDSDNSLDYWGEHVFYNETCGDTYAGAGGGDRIKLYNFTDSPLHVYFHNDNCPDRTCSQQLIRPNRCVSYGFRSVLREGYKITVADIMNGTSSTWYVKMQGIFPYLEGYNNNKNRFARCFWLKGKGLHCETHCKPLDRQCWSDSPQRQLTFGTIPGGVSR